MGLIQQDSFYVLMSVLPSWGMHKKRASICIIHSDCMVTCHTSDLSSKSQTCLYINFERFRNKHEGHQSWKFPLIAPLHWTPPMTFFRFPYHSEAILCRDWAEVGERGRQILFHWWHIKPGFNPRIGTGCLSNSFTWTHNVPALLVWLDWDVQEQSAESHRKLGT